MGAAIGAIDADFVMKILFLFVGLGSLGLIRAYVVILFLTMLSFERTLWVQLSVRLMPIL